MPIRGVVRKAARNSECGVFQYSLERYWGPKPGLVFVMLNPSIADAEVDDPTVRRCMGFAHREGCDGVLLLNLYAYRAADPRALRTCGDAVGPENDTHLRMTLTEQARRGTPVVAGWGATAKPDRAAQVLGLVPGVAWRCLGITKAGAPRHPLYVNGDQPLLPFG